jgi:acetyl esterase/lipase
VDPLRDQGVFFANRLKESGADTKLFFFKEYIHAFLQFDSLSFGIPEYRGGSKVMIEVIQELLDLKK